jgi:branched-subunit amino acid aminotransferase/4-amino-4-deoxychorismate lyase
MNTLWKEVDHALRLCHAYGQAMTSTTIRGSWLKTGFDYETRKVTTYRIVNEIRIRQGDAFREVWLFDYHPARISKSAASQRLEWINDHLFRKMERRFVKK